MEFARSPSQILCPLIVWAKYCWGWVCCSAESPSWPDTKKKRKQQNVPSVWPPELEWLALWMRHSNFDLHEASLSKWKVARRRSTDHLSAIYSARDIFNIFRVPKPKTFEHSLQSTNKFWSCRNDLKWKLTGVSGLIPRFSPLIPQKRLISPGVDHFLSSDLLALLCGDSFWKYNPHLKLSVPWIQTCNHKIQVKTYISLPLQQQDSTCVYLFVRICFQTVITTIVIRFVRDKRHKSACIFLDHFVQVFQLGRRIWLKCQRDNPLECNVANLSLLSFLRVLNQPTPVFLLPGICCPKDAHHVFPFQPRRFWMVLGFVALSLTMSSWFWEFWKAPFSPWNEKKCSQLAKHILKLFRFKENVELKEENVLVVKLVAKIYFDLWCVAWEEGLWRSNICCKHLLSTAHWSGRYFSIRQSRAVQKLKQKTNQCSNTCRKQLSHANKHKRNFQLTCEGENGSPLIGESFGVLGSLFIFFGEGVKSGDAALCASDAVDVADRDDSVPITSGSDLITASVFVKLVLCTLPLLVDDTDIAESCKNVVHNLRITSLSTDTSDAKDHTNSPVISDHRYFNDSPVSFSSLVSESAG